MKKFSVTMSLGGAGLATLLLLTVQGCTDLTENPPSLINAGNFFHTESEVQAGLAGIYAQLRSTAPEGSVYDANEVSTDEIVVPTRGSDWYDGGQWIDLHNQTWTPTTAGTRAFFNGAWNAAYTGVARTNLFLTAVANSTVPNKAEYVAEVRTLRAFYYYLLMDQFGGVPIVTDIELKLRPRNTRRELFDFIESELIAARDSGLTDSMPAAQSGRVTKGVADAILASMYLNAGVFTKEGAGAGGISATSYNSCLGVQVSGGQDACTAAIAAADRILNSGIYQLADTYATNFRYDNFKSKENIFVVKFAPKDGLGMGITMAALHYCQYAPLTPWNGFATLAQTYNAFDPADLRRNVFLVGPQVDVLSGAPATVRTCGKGAPLSFTTTIGDISAASEAEGPRIYKWPADPNHVQQNSGNDFAWFRLGEILLIRAEALNEQTPGSAAALALLNQLRSRNGHPVAPALGGPITRDMILNERLFELYGENKRRQDLIRFGEYTTRTDAASGIIGGKQASPDYYVLFPIPQTQIDANPNLTQNPGY